MCRGWSVAIPPRQRSAPVAAVAGEPLGALQAPPWHISRYVVCAGCRPRCGAGPTLCTRRPRRCNDSCAALCATRPWPCRPPPQGCVFFIDLDGCGYTAPGVNPFLERLRADIGARQRGGGGRGSCRAAVRRPRSPTARAAAAAGASAARRPTAPRSQSGRRGGGGAGHGRHPHGGAAPEAAGARSRAARRRARRPRVRDRRRGGGLRRAPRPGAGAALGGGRVCACGGRALALRQAQRASGWQHGGRA